MVVTICPPYSFYLPSEWWMRKERHANFALPSVKIVYHPWIVHISKSVIQGCGKRWRVLPHKKCRWWFMASLHSSQMDLVADFANYCNSHNSPRMLIYTGKLPDFNFLLFASCRQWSCPPIHGDHPFPGYSLGKDNDPTYPYCLSQPQQFPTTPISQYDKT